MTQSPCYSVLAFYSYTSIEDPQAEVKRHKEFFRGRNVTSRIYISEQGINGQMSATQTDAEAYIEWMHSRPLFAEMPFKIHPHNDHAFPRQTVKYRKQLVAFDLDIDLSDRGKHLSPKEWRQMLEKEDRIIVDIRNDYESKVGHFKGAVLPPVKNSREFATYADTLKDKMGNKNTPILMYCTGGIRCEVYSALLKKKGFKNVYLLEGGVINYGMREGSAHWLGKLFVFDDRVTIPISEEKNETISKCHHCGVLNDTYFNCANMDCNQLFLCCPKCLSDYAGCCQKECQTATNVRPYHHQTANKPFRKWHHYFADKKAKKDEQVKTT